MNYSQNYGPLRVIMIDDLTIPNTWGYQSGTLNLGTTQVIMVFVPRYSVPGQRERELPLTKP